MSATIHGLADLSFGITSDESGLVIQKMTVTRKGDKKEIRGKDGEFVAVAAGYGKKGDISINGYKRSTGITSNIGAALTVANTIAGNGLTGTLIIMDEITDDLGNEDFAQISVKGSAYNI
jgi:hypothetical protein